MGAARAVQLPEHPDHVALLRMLSDQRLEDPLVYLSNFSDLRQQAGRVRELAAQHASA